MATATIPTTKSVLEETYDVVNKTLPADGVPYEEWAKSLPPGAREAIESKTKHLGRPIRVRNYNKNVAVVK